MSVLSLVLAIVAQNQRLSCLIWRVCMSDATDHNAQKAMHFLRESLSKLSRDLKYTETTRYLCAAAHLQADFRNGVIKQVVEEEHRAIGECIDVDVASVVGHCLAARRRETLCNIALLVILLLFVFFLLTFQLKYCLLCLIMVWVVVFVELWICHYTVVARKLTRARYQPDAINFRLDPTLEQKISETQNANVVIYSSFTPFVGSGYPIGSWHLTLNITKGKQELEKPLLPPLPFELSEMYEHLTRAISELNIDGLSIKDKLYVHGEEIRDDQRFLAHPFARPHVQVDPSLVRTFIEKPTHSIRYYKCLQVMPRKGELVLSIFLNFSKRGPYLHTRAQYFLLPPLQETYYAVNAVHPNLGVGMIWQLLKASIATAPRRWILSPVELFKAFLLPLRHQIELMSIRRQIRKNRSFDYGATSSIRQDASASLQRRYFDRLDADMHLKIIERQILESTVEFLDAKNIDTTEFKKQQTTILSSGLIMTGGALYAESLAVGDHAKAETTRGDTQGGYDGYKQAE